MNRKRQKEIEEQKQIARKKKIFHGVVFPSTAIVIVIVLVGSGVIPIHIPQDRSQFSPPSTMPWGKFVQVSNKDMSSGITIYYVSWYGCPIGATDSWAFYLALEHFGNASLTYPVPHYSLSTDAYPNTPGIIFTHSTSFANISFVPIYAYNQTMTGTVSNQPYPGTLLTYGLSVTKSSLPSSVYSLEYDMMETVPTQGFNGQAAGLANGHINTNAIITGPKGAWALIGPLFSPSKLEGQSSSQLLNGEALNNTYILNGETAVLSAMEAAS